MLLIGSFIVCVLCIQQQNTPIHSSSGTSAGQVLEQEPGRAQWFNLHRQLRPHWVRQTRSKYDNHTNSSTTSVARPAGRGTGSSAMMLRTGMNRPTARAGWQPTWRAESGCIARRVVTLSGGPGTVSSTGGAGHGHQPHCSRWPGRRLSKATHSRFTHYFPAAV